MPTSPILSSQFRPRHGRRGRGAAVAAARAVRRRRPGAAQEDPGRDLPARRGRRSQRRGAARREGLLRSAAHHRHSASDQRAGKPTPRSISTASSACIRRSRRSSRSATSSTSRSSMPSGSPDPTRSHFDAQDYMESGTPGLKATQDGWMNRALPQAAGKVSPVRAVSLGPVLPRAMRGAIRRRSRCRPSKASRCATRKRRKQFEQMYTDTKDPLLQAAGRETFEAVAMLQSIQKPAVHAGRRRRLSARTLRRRACSRSRN